MMTKITLSREDMMAAITEGVRLAFEDLMDPGRDSGFKCIQDGVERAMWQLMTNATSAPCADFYASIKEGTEAALVRVAPALRDEEAGE